MEEDEQVEEQVDYSILLANAPDAMVLVNAKGVIQYANAQATRLFGYADDELLGATIESLVPERYRAVHLAHRAKFTQDPHPRAMGAQMAHLSGRRKNGEEFPVEINLGPLPEGLTIAAIRETDRERARRDWRRDMERDRERDQKRDLERDQKRDQKRDRATFSTVGYGALVVLLVNLLVYLFLTQCGLSSL